MKGAATIYLLSGLTLLGLDANATVSKGFSFGTLLFVIVGAACLVLARGLFLGRPQARLTSLVTSAFIAVGFGSLAVWFYLTAFPTSPKLDVPRQFWWLVGTFAAISLAFGLAFLMLVPTRARAP
jgi:hypothetical protein